MRHILKQKYYFLLIIIFFLTGCNRNKIVNDKTMKEFVITILRAHSNILKESVLDVDLDFRKCFNLYKNKPYYVKAVVSSTSGASIEFVPNSNIFKFNVIYTNKKITDFLFKHNSIDSNNHIFSVSAKNIYISDMSFITNGDSFLKVDQNGSVSTERIAVNDISYPNLLLIKGSNKKMSWTKSIAIEEAYNIFNREKFDAYVNSVEFRKFLITPQLKDIAEEIVKKRKNGDYNKTDRGALLFENDIKKLRDIAQQHNINSKYADFVLENTEKKPQTSFVEKHPWMFNIICGLLVIFFVYLLKKWIHHLNALF